MRVRPGRSGEAVHGKLVGPRSGRDRCASTGRELGRDAGEFLAATGLSDVIDAALVLLSADGDEIVTSDLDDFEQLVLTTGRHVELVRP